MIISVNDQIFKRLIVKVISILNTKGGSGKTTFSVNLIRAFQKLGKKVLLIDSDPQGSARDWHAAGGHEYVSVLGMDRPNIEKNIKGINRNYDIVIIDGAAHCTDLLISAIKASNNIFIPVQPHAYDVWASTDVVELIKTRQEILDGHPRSAFVITRINKMAKNMKAARETLSTFGFPILAGHTTQLVAYSDTAHIGRSVFETDNKSAMNEMLSLAKEIGDFIYDTSV